MKTFYISLKYKNKNGEYNLLGDGDFSAENKQDAIYMAIKTLWWDDDVNSEIYQYEPIIDQIYEY